MFYFVGLVSSDSGMNFGNFVKTNENKEEEGKENKLNSCKSTFELLKISKLLMCEKGLHFCQVICCFVCIKKKQREHYNVFFKFYASDLLMKIIV